MLSYKLYKMGAQINWALCLPRSSQNQVCFTSCIPLSFQEFVLPRLKELSCLEKYFLVLMFWKASYCNIRENISNCFCLEGCWGKTSNLDKFEHFGDCWACKKVWKLGNLCFWPSGMKPRNISCYMAYLDGFSSRLLQHSDRFCYVIVSVSGLGLTQQKQKYLKENIFGGGREENGNYTFSKLRFGFWATLIVLF